MQRKKNAVVIMTGSQHAARGSTMQPVASSTCWQPGTLAKSRHVKRPRRQSTCKLKSVCKDASSSLQLQHVLQTMLQHDGDAGLAVDEHDGHDVGTPQHVNETTTDVGRTSSQKAKRGNDAPAAKRKTRISNRQWMQWNFCFQTFAYFQTDR